MSSIREIVLAKAIGGSGGRDISIESLSATANGTYNPGNGKAYKPVYVNVPNSYTSGDEGKVVSNGALVSQTGTTKNANGTYDTTLNDEVVVDVPQTTIEALSVTENGTYTAPSGKAYSPVTVNVVLEWKNLKNYIASSGTQYIDTGYSAQNNSVFELIASINSSQGAIYANILGSRSENDPNDACMVTVRENSSKSIRRGWAQSKYYEFVNDSNSVFYVGKKTRFLHKKTSTYIENEDGDIGGGLYTNSGTASSYSLYLFGLNEGGEPVSNSFCAAKVYMLRIYEGAALVHEFIPWVDENEVVCMKDTVTGTLKYNAGTGTFVYGTDQ